MSQFDGKGELSRRELLKQGAFIVPIGGLSLGGVAAWPEQNTVTNPVTKSADDNLLPCLAKLGLDLDELRSSMRLACTWITDIAQMKDDQLSIETNSFHLGYKHWKGAIRGEYDAARRQWGFFAPIWHTGQAIKALVLAHRVLKEPALLSSAELGSQFIGAARIVDPNSKDRGLILGSEGRVSGVNTSCILEGLDGLIVLSKETGETKYWEWIDDAVAWIAKNSYMNHGMFRNTYSIELSKWIPPLWLERAPYKPGRPLLDDAIFLKVFHHTGIAEYRRIFYDTADRLLQEESPSGNWINFSPCNPLTGFIHPRQAFWWGYPLLDAYKDSGNAKYLDCAKRSGEWYLGAMRHDGGIFRGTYRDFKTDSFGHETSGICCAVILWHELWKVTHEDRWLAAICTALKYCMRLQFTRPSDPNLRGAILSTVDYPDGTDRLPYHLRDLDAIFFVQAVAALLSES